jgi:hypothetical protein
VKPDLPILGRISAVLQLMLVKVAVVPEDRLFQVAPPSQVARLVPPSPTAKQLLRLPGTQATARSV